MPWLRLDDKFWRNPKMRSVSHAARGVWVDAASYCADTPEPTGYLTEGEARQRATGSRRLIAELVACGAWEAVNGGYLIHDFDKYLDKGSRDRCRAWRERKRNEGVTSQGGHRDVRETSPRATGYSDNTDVMVNPGPVPEPGPDGDAVSKPLTNGKAAAERLRELAAPYIQPKP